MNTPRERTLAILRAREFFSALVNVPREDVTNAIRSEAGAILKHLPDAFDIGLLANGKKGVLAMPPSDDELDLSRSRIELSRQFLQDALRPALSEPSRLMLACDAGYLPLLAVAVENGFPDYSEHPNESICWSAFKAINALEDDRSLAIRLVNWRPHPWAQRCPPCGADQAIAWAQRIRNLALDFLRSKA
ncbi:BPSL0761 family protein [Burkholderia sp. PAMC 26561]|uniref:BPSL0761 family protein n=1 Tax=Burkholderia sp. PAMC 26561 TaxID=1795043 RepID=UPI000780EE9E|nr:BPSL0761 family protein [Burkholderia sp. PAMC 26561]